MCDILKFIFFNWTWESCIQFHFILQQNANDNKLYITIFSIFFIKHLKKTLILNFAENCSEGFSWK